MPGQVEHRDRYAKVHGLDALEGSGRLQPVLPRTREEGEVEPPVRMIGGQRADELAGVLPDAGGVPERRPIIDEDAHLCKSFRLSILL